MRKFNEVLDDYLELKNSNEMEHPGYIAGYTNKGYYEALTKSEDELNGFFTYLPTVCSCSNWESAGNDPMTGTKYKRCLDCRKVSAR